MTTALVGCATTDELGSIRGELYYQIQSVKENVAVVESQYPPLVEETRSLKAEIAQTNAEIARTNAEIPALRATIAELRAEITDVRGKIQQLRGVVDTTKEDLRKDIASVSAKSGKRDDADKQLREKIEALTFKTNFIENFLGIGNKDNPVSIAPDSVKHPVPSALKPDVREPVKTDKVALYNTAFGLFKEGKYEKARDVFVTLLQQYPTTELSDNALFWLGECYYFEKKYEKAIVEYDKVIKNYPASNKISYALLKQGLSFLKLDDKESARLLLQQVSHDYPNTSQARIAKAKLAEIK